MKYFLKSAVITGIALCILFMATAFCHAQADKMEDVVYLKNGSIIRGMILEQIPGESLKIETRDGSVFVFPMDEISRIVKEKAKIDTSAEAAKPEFDKRDPALAFALSFFFPGGGQFYNGENSKGAIMLGVAATGILLFIVFFDEGKTFIWAEEEEDFTDNQTLSLTGLFMAVGAMIWSWIDAPISASRINKEHGLAIASDKGLYLSMTNMDMDGKPAPCLKLTWKF